MNAIIAEASDPIMFKKSVKSGISRAHPVIKTTIIDLAPIFLIFCYFSVPLSKKGCSSRISKAAKI